MDSGSQQSASKAGQPPAGYPTNIAGWRLVFSAVPCVLSVFMDQSMNGSVAAAVPYMTGSTGLSVDEGRWLTTAYLSPYLIALILSPFVVELFGRRVVWATVLVIFAIASLGCAASSNSFGWLIFWRFVQGLSQGGFFLCAVSTVLTIFPKNISFIGFAVFAGMSLGGANAADAIGGYFVENNSWTSLFVMYAIIAAVTGTIVVFIGPDTPTAKLRPPFDGFGVALGCLASFVFVLLAQYGEQYDWTGSPSIVVAAAVLIVAFAAFVLWEGVFARYPFIDLRMYAVHNLRWGSFLALILSLPLFGSGTLVEYLSSSLHFSAAEAGGVVALRVVTVLLCVPFISYILGRKLVDLRLIIVVGFTLVAVSYMLQFWATTTTATFGTFVATALFAGAGFTMLFAPIASSILAVLPPKFFLRGIVIFKLVLVSGGTMAGTILQVIVDHRQSAHANELGSALQFGVPAFDNLAIGIGAKQAVEVLAPLLTAQSATLAYADSFLYSAILVVVVIPIAFMLQTQKK